MGVRFESFPTPVTMARNPGAPRLLGATSCVPEQSYTQKQVETLFSLKHPVVKKFLRASHIQKRHLLLPAPKENGRIDEETPAELEAKFAHHAVCLGRRALENLLDQLSLRREDIGMICAVTSTGFLVPGLASRLIGKVGLSSQTQKLDIVGMGCNAAVSALNPLVSWSRMNPEKCAVLVCCELNSAAYNVNDDVGTGLVNSLFGDAVSAVALQGGTACGPGKRASNEPPPWTPKILDFESLVLTEQLPAMRFDFDGRKNKRSFFLSKDIPFFIGRNAHRPVERLLDRHGYRSEDIDHWVIHTGGEAVINGVKRSLGLSEEDVRHTRSVLRDYGNVSSGSVLISLERLLEEGRTRPGDRGVMLAMGPGASIDAALLQWDS